MADNEDITLGIEENDGAILSIGEQSELVRFGVTDSEDVAIGVEDNEDAVLNADDQSEDVRFGVTDAIIEAVSPTAEVTKAGHVATITITDKNGTTTANVYDGVDGAGGDKHYTHVQGVPSADWIVNHNLDKYPAVTVSDSSGNIVEGDYEYVDENNMILHFNSEFSGVAYFN